MAKVEDLIDEIADPVLRERIAHEVKDLKETKRFGLVFEEHIPETVSLYGLPIRPGLIVQNRTTPQDLTELQVLSVEGNEAIVVPKGSDEPRVTVGVTDLLVVKRFHEQIFPGLAPVGEVRRGADDQPAHVIINGENFHALQVLAYTYAGNVDCIYIDPPYNTGDKSWKYNNRFVDENDSYRHSKWLSFMEKRLRLAEVLLKPDGVLIVTIDEHEVHHLGVLLEDLFPSERRQMVTIVINPAGVSQGTFARVEEHVMFTFFGDSSVQLIDDDMLSVSRSRSRSVTWDSVLRRGTNALPSDRPNLVYPVGVDPDTGRIVGTGRSLRDRVAAGELTADDLNSYRPDASETVDGYPVSWPIRTDGTLGNWRLGAITLAKLAEEGFVRTGVYDAGRRMWPLSYLGRKDRQRIVDGDIVIVDRDADTNVVTVAYREDPRTRPKTVWNRSAHNAGTNGAELLKSFLGSRAFNFPKSLYAVHDALATVILGNPDALVVDFFAGSGTTLHATALLNARDSGRRRCVLVTNNEVTDSVAKSLGRKGVFRGDPEFEALGIFEAVTMPRCEAAITGIRADGERVPGEYADGYLKNRSYADGLEENALFFRLDYLDPDLVELGRQFNAIAPMLWMTAGSVGEWEEWDGAAPWSMPEDSTYGVLFDEDHLSDFAEAVEAHGSTTHVWIVTNSHAAFAEMRQALPENLVEVRQLYRDYLRNFAVNAPGVLRT